MIEDRIRYIKLFDLYGALLTEKQKKCVELYLFEDFSLAEISDELAISRQGVHDHLSRAKKKLEELEKKMRLLQE